jgi:ATP-binding cassette subfamily B protein
MKNNKPTHSIISNVKYFFGLQWSYSKLSVVFLILLIPINISISFINIYLPKLVVSEIINQRPFEHIVFSLLTIGIILILLNISNKAISSSNSALMLKFRYGLLNRKVSKAFKTDYENIEAPQFRYLMSRADESLWGSGKGSIVERMTSGITELITNILGYILFGSILSVINPWIAVVLTLFSLIHYFSLRRVRKFQHANREEISKLDYKLWYIASNSSSFEGAADVRIYGMNRWFINMFKTLTKERLGWDRKILWRTYITHIIDALIIILRDGFAYAILITKVLNGDLSIDNFIFHFAAVGSFASLVGGILEKYNDIYSVSLTSCDLRDYLEYPEKENRGEGSGWDAFVAEIDGKIVGFVTLKCDDQTLCGILGNNSVDPAYQGRGIGKRLYKKAMDTMREKGMKYARVDTGLGPTFASARKAYEQSGFDRQLQTVIYYTEL